MDGEEVPSPTSTDRRRQAAATLRSMKRLPSAGDVLLLHLSGWRDRHGWAGSRDGASGGIHNGDRITCPLCHGLVQLHVLLIARRVVGIGSGGEEEGWCWLRLML